MLQDNTDKWEAMSSEYARSYVKTLELRDETRRVVIAEYEWVKVEADNGEIIDALVWHVYIAPQFPFDIEYFQFVNDPAMEFEEII